MDIIQKIHVEGLTHVSITMDRYLEKSKYFMALCQDNNITIQRYYWRSIFDETIIEYIQPKIVDAFYMIIDVYGEKETVEHVIKQYSTVNEDLSKLSYIKPLSNEEINKYALQFSII